MSTEVFTESIDRFLEPIAHLMRDSSISEIMINGHRSIWVERSGIVEPARTEFPSDESLRAAITNISQYSDRPISPDRPILEAHLPDGSRLEAVMPPIAKNGPTVAIRKFSRSTLTVQRLVELGSLSKRAAEFLAAAIRKKLSVVVSGGTGSGKTSLLAMLASFSPDRERIVVIEDTHEIRIDKPHVVYLEARTKDRKGRGEVAIRDLLRATLRLRPDRIVVGEVRGGEALDLVQSMTSGHGGSLTTVHASSGHDAIRRIETMSMMADTGLPLAALKSQIASAIDLVVQAERFSDGQRLVTEISHVRGLGAGGHYAMRRLFTRRGAGPLRAVKRRKEDNHGR